jgi:hypothetical protein
MNDEEIRKLMERTDEELNTLYGKWMTHFQEPKPTAYAPVFTPAEEKGWFELEPDFTKRIATPLNAKRPPDKLPVYL